MRMIFRSFLLLFVFALISCSENMLEAFADKETDAAKYVQANLLINDANYDEAVTVLLSTSAEFQTQREVRALLASAYAGRGGLSFLSLIETLENATSVRLYPLLMESFLGGTSAKVLDLGLAEDTLNLISTDPALRTEDENTFMALIYLAKIGNILNLYTDTDSTGTVDGTFVDACVDTDNPGTAINDSNVGEVGISLLGFMQIIPYLSDNFTSGVMGSLDDCVDDIESLDVNFTGMCAVDDPNDYTALHIKAFRSLIKEDSLIGFGISCTGDVTACNCP